MPFATGVPAPWFSGRTETNDSFSFNTVAGRYVVLCFFGSADFDDHRRILGDFMARSDQFDDTQATFFGVSIDPEDEEFGRISDRDKGVRFFRDFDRSISRLYGALPHSDSPEQSVDDALTEYRPFTLVLDERLRVLAHFGFAFQSDMHVARVFQFLEAQPKPGPPTPAAMQAPVLIVPRVFEPDLCRQLIQLYNEQGGEDSGFMRDVAGQTVGIVDYGHKRRRDFTIEDEEMRTRCMHRIHDRLIPEIEKAFQFKATRMERYIVACYEGKDGGHFRAHRDNTTLGTAHRRFAVTLNLNAEQFEGGELRFPEFGPHLYKPPTGGACVFSCSLLHAATPVTSGTRYVFLPFLYDDAAAKIRDQNQKFIAESAPAVETAESSAAVTPASGPSGPPLRRSRAIHP